MISYLKMKFNVQKESSIIYKFIMFVVPLCMLLNSHSNQIIICITIFMYVLISITVY